MEILSPKGHDLLRCMVDQKEKNVQFSKLWTTKMGKVTFKSDQPTQSLSGTLGGVTYRVDAEGKTFAFIRSHSSVPVIDECIDEIQQQQIRNHPTTPQQLADRRKALYMRIKRLYLRYKDHPQLIDNPDELRKAILLAYRQKRKR